MPSKEVGSIHYRLGMDTKGFESAAQRIKKTTKRLAIGFTAFAGVATILGKKMVDSYAKQEQALAQVRQGLKSTKGVSGKTFKELTKQASDLQAKTLFGDEEILQGATAQLLTFTNITGKQFDRTQEAALNLATRLDGDLKSASIQLGKALNDPIANLSALSRSGIQFSEEQKAVIKEMAETNRLAEAQTLILDELENQYGGAAEAAGNTLSGKLKKLGNQFGDVQEKIGFHILKGLEPFIDKIHKFVQTEQFTVMMEKFGIGIENFFTALFDFLASEGFSDFLKNIRDLAEKVWSFFKTFLVPVFKAFADAIGIISSNAVVFNGLIGSLIALKLASWLNIATIALTGASGVAAAGGVAGLAGGLRLFIGKAGLWGLFAVGVWVAFDAMDAFSSLSDRLKGKLQALADKTKMAKGVFLDGMGSLDRSSAETRVYRDGKWQPFAKGGPFNAGQPMLVGEEGPELIVPDGAGTVIPNGGGGLSVYGGITVNDRASLDSLGRMLGYNQELAIEGIGVRK